MIADLQPNSDKILDRFSLRLVMEMVGCGYVFGALSAIAISAVLIFVACL